MVPRGPRLAKCTKRSTHYTLHITCNKCTAYLKASFSTEQKIPKFCFVLGHSGTFACAFCDGHKTLLSGELRTFSSIVRHHQKYLAAGSPVKDQAQYSNCIKVNIVIKVFRYIVLRYILLDWSIRCKIIRG